MIRESLLRKDIRISFFASQVEFDNTANQPQWGNFLGGVLSKNSGRKTSKRRRSGPSIYWSHLDT